jgi:hypothetical protein
VIFVVSDAGVVEQGTHDALMQLNGVYAHLYRLQSNEGVVAEPEDADETNAVPVAGG